MNVHFFIHYSDKKVSFTQISGFDSEIFIINFLRIPKVVLYKSCGCGSSTRPKYISHYLTKPSETTSRQLPETYGSN